MDNISLTCRLNPEQMETVPIVTATELGEHFEQDAKRAKALQKGYSFSGRPKMRKGDGAGNATPAAFSGNTSNENFAK